MGDEDALTELALELPQRKRKAKVALSSVTISETEPDYTYMELLERVYRHEHAAPVPPKFALPLPQMMRRGNRTLLVNFAALCRQMNRTTDHLQRFVAAELQAETSVDGNSALVLRCKVLPARMTALLRQYCALYVQCLNCKGFHTSWLKDVTLRLHFVSCNQCQARRAVKG